MPYLILYKVYFYLKLLIICPFLQACRYYRHSNDKNEYNPSVFTERIKGIETTKTVQKIDFFEMIWHLQKLSSQNICNGWWVLSFVYEVWCRNVWSIYYRMMCLHAFVYVSVVKYQWLIFCKSSSHVLTSVKFAQKGSNSLLFSSTQMILMIYWTFPFTTYTHERSTSVLNRVK